MATQPITTKLAPDWHPDAIRDHWTAPGLVDNSLPHAAALSNASGLTPQKGPVAGIVTQ
jgi:hypothetical protein